MVLVCYVEYMSICQFFEQVIFQRHDVRFIVDIWLLRKCRCIIPTPIELRRLTLRVGTQGIFVSKEIDSCNIQGLGRFRKENNESVKILFKVDKGLMISIS